MRVLMTVCLGNLCRSPLAAAMFTRELPDWQVLSAGLAAQIGDYADETTRTLASREGWDLSAHRAQAVSALLCQQAELILVMERAHKQALERQHPTARGKVFRLGEWLDLDIVDPYRQPQAAHEAAQAAIARAVASWLPRIRKL